MEPAKENPWQTLSTQKIYDNPWVVVSESQVINPKGGRGIYGTVHFKNYAYGIIPVDEQLNTWLVGQYRYSLNEYSWEIPMGGGLRSVDKLLSAQRELKEETGLVAEKWTEIMRIHTSNSVTDEEGFVFIAEKLHQQETEEDETEMLTLRKLPFTEALQMVLDQRITDAISIAGLLKAARILKI